MAPSRHEHINCKNVLSDRKFVADDQIKLFCDILRFQGDRGEGHHDEQARRCYADRIRPLLTKLKFPLSKPKFLTQILLPDQSRYTYLCDLHNGLNADFVHQWFKFVSLEVGARLELLRNTNREHVGTCVWDNVIKPLTRLHKLWLSTDELEEAFGNFVQQGFEHSIGLIDATYQADGCEACILARIGAHINTLWALRCLVKSRITLESQAKHPNRLRLLRLLEPWIELWNDRYNQHEEVTRKATQFKWNTGLAEEIYEKRKEIEVELHRRRRAQRNLLELEHSNSKKYKEYVKALKDNAAGNSLHDAENDIIDTYAALRDTQRASALLSGDTLTGGCSQCPAYKCGNPPDDCMAMSNPDIEGSGNSPYTASPNPAYLESRYSIDTFMNNERVIRARSNTLAKLQGSEKLDEPSSCNFRADCVTTDQRFTQTTVWPVEVDGSRVNLLGQKRL